MATMFGAPLGTSAASLDAARDTQSTVQIMQALSEAAEAPINRRLKSAQAGHYEALAGAKRAENADAEALAGWEARARQRLVEGTPQAEGRSADVGDLQPRPRSNTEALQALYDTMEQGGAPTRMLASVAKQIADISKEETQAYFNYARAQNEELETGKRQADMLGSIVKAGMSSPQGYAQMRMMLAQQPGGVPPQLRGFFDALPPDWEQGKNLLAPLAQRALSVKDAIAVEQRERELRERALTEQTTRARNNASAAAATARTEGQRIKNKMLMKIGGQGTPEQVASQEALTEARMKKMEADQLKTSPYIPLEKSKISVGKTYTLKDGSVVRAVSVNGDVAFDVLSGPWKQRSGPRSAAEIREERRAAMADAGEED